MQRQKIRFVPWVIDAKAHDNVQKLLEHVFPEWQDKDVVIDRFGSGSVNAVYHCCLKDDTAKVNDVVMRIHGDTGSGTVMDRNKEFMMMQLAHASGIFPEILAVFRNGAVYRYAAGKSLQPASMVDEKVIKATARLLAKLHAIRPDTVELVDVQGSSSQLNKEDICETMRNLWRKKPITISPEARNVRYQRIIEVLGLQMVDMVADTMTSMHLECGVVHRDVSFENLIYDECNDAMTLLDYEFSSFGCWTLLDLATVTELHHYLLVLFNAPRPSEPRRHNRRDWLLRTYLSEILRLNSQESTETFEHHLKLVDLQLQAMEIAYHLIMFLMSLTFVHKEDMKIEPLLFSEVGCEQFSMHKARLFEIKSRYLYLKHHLN